MKKQWKRMIALLLVLMLSVGLVPDAVYAKTQKASAEPAGYEEAERQEESSQDNDKWQSIETITYINPLYADVIDESDLKKPEEGIKDSVPYAIDYYTSLTDATNAMREELIERKTTVQIGLKTSDGNSNTISRSIFNDAMNHTGVPKEGDYLMWQWGGWTCTSNTLYQGNTYTYTFTYTITYYTTAQQEAQVDSEIPQVLDGLNLDGKTNYEKVKTIYDYICDNVAYDYTNVNNENYTLQYTAYAALFDKKAVCQGYSVLFYRMALEEGVDARVITGDGGGPHAWNIVQLGNKYYNLDSTWDAGKTTYSYFLRCNNNFNGHTRDTEYNTATFNATYPMGAVDYDPASEPVLMNVNQCSISLDTTDFVYDSKEKKPKVTVKYGNATLTENTDYKVGYSDNINAGTAKVSITGMGGYTGEVTKYFTINKAEQTLNVSVEKNSIKVGETLAITTGGTEKGSLTYSSDQASVATVSTQGIITGIGEGSATITVQAAGDNNYNAKSETISILVGETESPEAISNCVISLQNVDSIYDGKEKKPKVTVKYGNATLTENTDYKVGYSDNINAGTAKVSITGMGGYTGEVTKYFTIKKAEQTLNVSVEKNSIKVGETLAITTGGTEKGSLTYSSDQAAVATVSTQGIITGIGEGSATITVQAAGNNNYNEKSGTISIIVKKAEPSESTTEEPTEPTTEAPTQPTTQAPTVQPTQPAAPTPVIETPQSTTVKKLKNKKGKKVLVTWDARPNVSGYLIQCAANKKFTKKLKEYIAEGADMTSGVIPKLKKYTYYYVRIKTYKENSGSTYYSDWSNVKKVLVYR